MKRLRHTYRGQQAEGQSLVEMALILPLLLILLFGIIDLGYYVYSYASVYQAVRRGTDTAALFPPYQSQLGSTYNTDDMCVQVVVNSVKDGAVLVNFDDIAINRNKFNVSYYENPEGASVLHRYRDLGDTVQVAITYTIEPLTPLFQMVPLGDGHGRITVRASSMRTVVGRGETLVADAKERCKDHADPPACEAQLKKGCQPGP
ncbi:MAG: hypothetical protein HC884_14495 [Chloroflexaceae bacterium]|nr:hypothetical protein [Chloroflexaceae bacterium]